MSPPCRHGALLFCARACVQSGTGSYPRGRQPKAREVGHDQRAHSQISAVEAGLKNGENGVRREISLKAKLGEHLRYSKGIITFYYPLLTRRCSPMSIFGVFEHLRDRQMSIFVAGPWQRVFGSSEGAHPPSKVLISHEDAHTMSIFGNLVVFIRLLGSKNARKTRRCSPFRITGKTGILHPKTTTLIGPLVKNLGVSAGGFLKIAPSLEEGSKFFSIRSGLTSFFPSVRLAVLACRFPSARPPIQSQGLWHSQAMQK